VISKVRDESQIIEDIR